MEDGEEEKIREKKKEPDVYSACRGNYDSSLPFSNTANKKIGSHSDYKLIYLHGTTKSMIWYP